jgi:hypothetical protein
MRTLLSRLIVPGVVGLVLVMGMQSATAAPKKTKEDCDIDHDVCLNNACKGPAGDLGPGCAAQCDATWIDCTNAADKKKETGADPITPRTGDHMTPIGGAKKVAQ